ncbi:hypothetical protein SBOR_8424 [Sclerotinia borealis F-4128]|uniref:Uncharacterized protein n=1 Tax=Sclerotinia borealis (strain F-4128) TaxID=1432307 RepID=W9C5N9_SCLBF|nr:hypothetical protein SBOR_8424 [Sclerotinia borealis F-4128]
MIFFNPSSIMRNMIAFLSILVLTVFVTTATPISEDEGSTILPRAVLCKLAAGGWCTLSVANTPGRIKNKQGTDYIWLWDSQCNPIGGGWVGLNIDLASQLRYKIIGIRAHDSNLKNMPDF